MDNTGLWLLIAVLAVTSLVLWWPEIVAFATRVYRRFRPLPEKPPPTGEIGIFLFGGGGSPAPEAPDWWPVDYWPKYYWPISYWPKVGTNIVGAPAAAVAEERPHVRMDVRYRRGR